MKEKLKGDRGFENIRIFLESEAFTAGHETLSNDMSMLGVLGGKSYGVRADNISRSQASGLCVLYEFKSGERPVGITAVTVRTTRVLVLRAGWSVVLTYQQATIS